MKLKAFLLSGLFLILLFSCENRDEVNSVNLETELVVKISLTSESNNPLRLKSQSNDEVFSFEGTGIFCLAQNNVLNKPMYIVKDIKSREGCKIVFQGSEEGNILSLKLRWDSKSNEETDFDMQSEVVITSLPLVQNNENWEINLSSNIIDPLVNCIDSNPTCLYRVDIIGTADFILPSEGLIEIPVTAISSAHSINFTLF